MRNINRRLDKVCSKHIDRINAGCPGAGCARHHGTMVDLAFLTDEITDPFQFPGQLIVASNHFIQCVIDLACNARCINWHANREIPILETCQDSQDLSVVHYVSAESFNFVKPRAHGKSPSEAASREMRFRSKVQALGNPANIYSMLDRRDVQKSF